MIIPAILFKELLQRPARTAVSDFLLESKNDSLSSPPTPYRAKRAASAFLLSSCRR
ncbi:hypothetical protein [Pseudobacillus wudalianchiensis]|uniref:hypothetical protein n=1 Tax=Pseudobacillus wudalianchiensis TaxID=1743143 RepID=UPI001C40109D|nr:hypothetical protein [Bacillus wudalianchiensis]